MAHLKAHKQIFIDLQDRFSSLADQLKITLTTAEHTIQDTLSRLQNTIDSAGADLDDAKEILSLCRDDNEKSDCNDEEMSVYIFQTHVKDLINALREFEHQVAAYENLASIAWQLVDKEIPYCRSQLLLRERIVDRLWTDLGTLQSSAPSSVSSTTEVHRGSSGRNQWNTERTEINVADLPDPEDITGSEDFKKWSLEEMTEGFNKLQIIRSEMANGRGLDVDHWRTYDQEQGLEPNNSYAEVFNTFYGENNSIKLVIKNGQYDIVNGRHRIWLAKKLGIQTLPVSLSSQNSKK